MFAIFEPLGARTQKMFFGLRIFKHGHLLIIGIMTSTVSHKVHLTGWETSSDSNGSFHCFFFLGRKFQFLTSQHGWKAAQDQHDGENETSCERSCHTSSEQTWRHRPLRLSLNFIPFKIHFQKSIPIYYIYCTTIICTSEINIIKIKLFSLFVFCYSFLFYLFH